MKYELNMIDKATLVVLIAGACLAVYGLALTLSKML